MKDKTRNALSILAISMVILTAIGILAISGSSYEKKLNEKQAQLDNLIQEHEQELSTVPFWDEPVCKEVIETENSFKMKNKLCIYKGELARYVEVKEITFSYLDREDYSKILKEGLIDYKEELMFDEQAYELTYYGYLIKDIENDEIYKLEEGNKPEWV